MLFKNRRCSICRKSKFNVLGKVKTLITESGCEILDVVIHRAHPIDRGYKTRNMADKVGNVPCQSIIVRFLTFQHRTLFYQNRNKLKHVKVRLDHTVQDIYRSQWLCESMQKCWLCNGWSQLVDIINWRCSLKMVVVVSLVIFLKLLITFLQ